ncbi:MAG: hypothetical protein CVU69_08745 [Deltaproteobacteria bacterium HGW-Deltaproteobacteria-4]|nr:MAG: hypothetical protein CVU69_08745 [Deltaproteobacteria bacterium HGW-Deltaproteobacteria-4]
MSFSGDLEHLPIVDIVQLLNSTRKSGTLKLVGGKGESRLVFSDGHIICANHSNNSVRLGQVLISMNAITPELLQQTLEEQKQAGEQRQPLVAMLIETGQIDKELAFKGLEALIVMTIIDILTWDGGTFTVDVDDVSLSEDYQYLPERFKKDFCANTQNVLMDALRIYDEKMRDGNLTSGSIFPDNVEENPATESTFIAEEVQEEAPGMHISSDILGLDVLDHLEKKIPDVFKGLHVPLIKQKSIEEIDLGEISGDDRLNLLAAIEMLTPPEEKKSGGDGQLLILFSCDRLLKGAISTLCKRSGRSFFMIDAEESLDLLIENALAKELTPLLVIDTPNENHNQNDLFALLSKRNKIYPELVTIQLYAPEQCAFALRMLTAGSQLILPRITDSAPDKIVENTIALLTALHCWLSKPASSAVNKMDKLFISTLKSLETITEPADISPTLLKFVAATFTRGQTFVVVKDHLIAERGFDRDRQVEGIGPFPLKSKISINDIKTFADVVASGQTFWGIPEDFQIIAETATTPPRLEKILLLPILVDNRTIAVVYGDYGLGHAAHGQCERLSILAKTAGLVLEKVLRQKKSAV